MWRDLRFGLRQVLASRLFSLTIVVLLAVGIGANTLVFTLVNELLLKPLPVRNPENLYLLQQIEERSVRPNTIFAYSIYREVVLKSNLFQAAVAEQEWGSEALAPFESGGSHRLVVAQIVSPNYFSELGVQAVAGRVLTEADAADTPTPPAVLSYQFWQSQFSGDRSAVGQTIRVKNAPFIVVGVLPREFHSSDIDRAPDIRLPISAANAMGVREAANADDQAPASRFQILVRLGPGITPARAAAELAPALRERWAWNTRQMNAARKEPYPPEQIEASIKDVVFRLALASAGHGMSQLRDQFSRSLRLLLGGVALLLLAVCANVSGLLLAKSGQRRREMGIRLAVGAGRPQLIRQLLTECLLLAAPGAAAGAALAYLLAPAVVRLLPAPRDYGQLASARILSISPDPRVLLFSTALAAFCVLAFGLMPAWRATGVTLSAELKTGRGQGHSSFAGLLPVGLQVALGVVLVAGAGLMLRTFWKLDHLDPGFDREHLVEFTTEPAFAGYTAEQRGSFYRELRNRVAALPGVRSVAYAGRGIMRGVGLKTTLSPQGTVLPASTFLNTSMNEVEPGYFQAMGIPLLAGRDLSLADRGVKPMPIVVNRAFADSFFPNQNIIGKQVVRDTDGNKPPTFVIVGLAGTAKYRSFREPDPPTFYELINENRSRDSLLLYVHTYGSPAAILGPVRQIIGSLDPAVPLIEALTIEQEVQTSLWQERLVAILAAFFGAASLLLAGIGLYGSLAWSVTQRSHELGIRVALGARIRHIVRTVCGPMLIAVAAGLAVGAAASVYALRLTEKLLFGVRALDPASFAAALAFVGLCAALAAMAPSWRAARIDPSRALREE